MAGLRSTAQRRPLGARGLTLAELLTALAIISLTLLIVVPTFTGLGASRSLRNGANELASTFREARRRAIAERADYCVVIDCNVVEGPDSDPRLITRYWIARLDTAFDPATDTTDLPDADGLPPFDGVFTKFDLTGEGMEPTAPRELPENIVVVSARIQSTDFQGDDFATFRLNAMRTEDFNLDGVLDPPLPLPNDEDVGVDGVDDGDGQDDDLGGELVPVNEGEDDRDIDSVYRVIRFGAQGNADRASILLWDLTDGSTPLPTSIAPNAPASLRALGLPPGMTVQDPTDQRNYFTVSDQGEDWHYYTLEVNPITGQTQIYDYARGSGPLPTDPGPPPPPWDWNPARDGTS